MVKLPAQALACEDWVVVTCLLQVKLEPDGVGAWDLQPTRTSFVAHPDGKRGSIKDIQAGQVIDVTGMSQTDGSLPVEALYISQQTPFTLWKKGLTRASARVNLFACCSMLEQKDKAVRPITIRTKSILTEQRFRGGGLRSVLHNPRRGNA